MTYTFKLARRIARLRHLTAIALAFSLAACGDTDAFEPGGSHSPSTTPDTPELATSFAGGIPIGTSAQPNEYFGGRYNGGWRNIWPEFVVSNLSEIKSRGGKVILMMAGPNSFYKDADGHFSMSKWKARIDRYRDVDFSSYIRDGTVIAHVLVDEPNDPTNWNGQPIPPSTVETMAQYSKSIWPDMPTVVRAYPSYMAQWSGTYQYLDAAWAQYVCRLGTASDFIGSNVRLAQSKGLSLVVGLNLVRGNCEKAAMTATEVQNWGSTLLSSTYPCAFISYQFDEKYLSSAGIQSAMDLLRSKAENRESRSCRSGSDPAPLPPSEPDPDPEPAPPPPTTSGDVLPFGLLQAPLSAYTTRWSGTLYNATPTYLVGRLEKAQSVGMRMVVRLADPRQVTNSDGTFSLTKWKAQVDRYRTLSLGGYVSDRTFYVHLLVDRPNCASCWGGHAIPWSTLEEMASYSKTIWPQLSTMAGAEPSELASASFTWRYLDAGWVEYDTRKGSIGTYLKNESTQAQLEGLGIVAGLNLLRGSAGNPMTASQIKEFGTVLARSSSVCGLVGRRYDTTYLSQSGILQALDSVAAVARTRTPGSCSVS